MVVMTRPFFFYWQINVARLLSTSVPITMGTSTSQSCLYLSTLAWLGVRPYGVARLLLLLPATAGADVGGVVVSPANGAIAAGAAVGVACVVGMLGLSILHYLRTVNFLSLS